MIDHSPEKNFDQFCFVSVIRSQLTSVGLSALAGLSWISTMLLGTSVRLKPSFLVDCLLFGREAFRDPPSLPPGDGPDRRYLFDPFSENSSIKVYRAEVCTWQNGTKTGGWIKVFELNF